LPAIALPLAKPEALLDLHILQSTEDCCVEREPYAPDVAVEAATRLKMWQCGPARLSQPKHHGGGIQYIKGYVG